MALEDVAELSLKEWQEYMWSTVNVLPNSAKIPHLNNGDFSEHNMGLINGNLG